MKFVLTKECQGIQPLAERWASAVDQNFKKYSILTKLNFTLYKLQ